MRPLVKKGGINLLSSAIIGLILPVLWLLTPDGLLWYLFAHDFSGYWEITAINMFYELLFLGDVTLSYIALATSLYLFNVVLVLSVLFVFRILWRLLLAMSRE